MAKQTFTTGQVLTAAQMTSLQQTAMGGGSTTAKTTSYVLVAADAGTVVQMNAAGATTITVNTALFAAGDSVQIQNIGAGVCTVTAGTATVTTAGSLALSQWEGGQLYFTSTSASIFFDIVQGAGMTNPLTTTGDTIYSLSGTTAARLGIGSTGNVLTVAGGIPSWAAPAAGGGLTLISTTTATAATSIAITSIPATYKNLLLVYSCYQSTTTGYWNLRFNNSSSANYGYVGSSLSNTTVSGFAGGPGGNKIGTASDAQAVIMAGDTSGSADYSTYGIINIYDYTNTAQGITGTYQTQNATNAGTPQSVNGQFYYGAATAISQINFFRSATQTITGVFKLYGVS
jgi:hypothetical protein